MKIIFGDLELTLNPDDEKYFSEATATFSHLSSNGTAVFKDCRGNYAETEETFDSEEEFLKHAER